MSNAHIENFLEYYLKLKESPGYAVLLSGDWGSGKTWFLKTFMDTKDHKYLWASFNGVSRYSEIEDQFFEQLHPRLASKEMKLAGKIFKGLLKATVKIDWDDDGKADGSATIQNPDLKKSDFLNTDKYVVVFDDIERSQMEIEEVLGYINQYVEVVGQKVICICNEKDIIEKTERYQKIREKVIGKVFEVNPDFQEILGRSDLEGDRRPPRYGDPGGSLPLLRARHDAHDRPEREHGASHAARGRHRCRSRGP